MKFSPARIQRVLLGTSALLAFGIFTAGCTKKAPIPPPPAAPAANRTTPGGGGDTVTGRPTATLTAEPARIERGQTATLSWTTSGSNDVSINNGIGTVAPTGNRTITPSDTITYTLTANGPNGSTTATATVTITSPPPPPPAAPRVNPLGTLESRVQSDLRDALFDYDSVNIRDDAHAALTADAEALKRIFADFPAATVNVEGHCDERGSAEYNLGLGDRRATSARDFLVQLGVPAAKLRTISYGKERPTCTEADEACYQKNRRAHLSAGQ
jgi:peptidoglycan-associated lipoprotein